MAAGEGVFITKQIAAVVAAVHAYLDAERRIERSRSSDVGAWRSSILPASNDGVASHRSWTGRDAAISAR